MAKGGKGIRINIVALEPHGGTGYTLSRLRVPATEAFTPQTPDQVFELWWHYADLWRMTTTSDLTRLLPASPDHETKVLRALVKLKTNVFIYPAKMGKSPAEQFVQRVVQQFTENEEVFKYQAWLLGQIRGGAQQLGLPAARPVNTGHDGIDLSYARIWRWLDKYHKFWGTGLQHWEETKEDWLNRERKQPRKKIVTHEPRKGTSRQALRKMRYGV